MWGRDRRQIVWDACHLVSTLCLSLSLKIFVDIQRDIQCYINLYISRIKTYVAT